MSKRNINEHGLMSRELEQQVSESVIYVFAHNKKGHPFMEWPLIN